MSNSKLMLAVLICAGLALAPLSCKRNKAPKKVDRKKTPAVKIQTEMIKQALKVLPGAATAIVVLDAGWLQKSALKSFSSFMPNAKVDLAGMLAKIKAVCTRHIGIDCTSSTWLAAYFNLATKGIGVVIDGSFGDKLKGPGPRPIDGVPTFSLFQPFRVAMLGGKLLVGNPAGLKALIAVNRGKQKSVSDSPAAISVKSAQLKVGSGLRLFAYANLAQAARALPFPLAAASLGFGSDGKIGLMLSGPQTSLTKIKSLVKSQLSAVLAEMQKMETKFSTSGPLIAAIPAIITNGYASAVIKTIDPKIEGTTMTQTIDMSGINVGAFVPISGLLAVVAIPAFVRYMRKAKTTEALRAMQKIYKGAFRYASKSWPDASGNPTQCRFPESTDWTPKGSPCKHPGRKFPDNPNAWSGKTWNDLLFKMSGPHYYQYRVTRKGIGNNSVFTIEARGDLDCDGTWSNFKRIATLKTATGGMLNCRIEGKWGVFIKNETE